MGILVKENIGNNCVELFYNKRGEYIHLEMEQNKFLQGGKNLHIICLVIC